MTLLSIKKLVAWLFEYSSWANKASRAILALQSGNIGLLLKKMGQILSIFWEIVFISWEI
jgi:hypothetical protein